jgi:hypothetical protein
MIILPRTTEDGRPKISYSQIGAWNELKSFNQIFGEDGKLKEIDGKTGYILKYFFNYEFPPSPMDIYAPFGSACEDCICKGECDDFSDEEVDILMQVEPLGVFQAELAIDFGDFVLQGFIDDCNEDRSHIRDYKTASVNSSKKYREDSYTQLDVYALDKYKKTGELPNKLEVIVIERGGSHFTKNLYVKSIMEPIIRQTSVERLLYVENKIITTVREISDCYKVFLELNNIK